MMKTLLFLASLSLVSCSVTIDPNGRPIGSLDIVEAWEFVNQPLDEK